MKVILLTDIPKIGRKYEVKDFKEGYAQNVLLAKGLAEHATPHALSRLADMKAKQKRKEDEENQAFETSLQTIAQHSLILHARANDKGHLFKAIGPKDIIATIKEITGIIYNEALIEMSLIKEIGTHTIRIQKGKSRGEFTISVTALQK